MQGTERATPNSLIESVFVLERVHQVSSLVSGQDPEKPLRTSSYSHTLTLDFCGG